MKARADFFETFKVEFTASKKMKNRLLRYWGTETIDGIEVFNKKFTVYPGLGTPRVARITNMFGATKSLAQNSYEGLESFYFRLNPEKSRKIGSYDRQFLVDKFNSYLTIGESRTIDLNIEDSSDPARFNGMTSDQILAYVTGNYSDIITSDRVEANGDTILDSTLGVYILLADPTKFDLVTSTAAVVPRAKRIRVGSPLYPRYVTVYESSITMKVTYKQLVAVSEDDAIIDAMYAEKDEFIAGKVAALLLSEANDSEEELADRSLAITDVIWYKGQLRVSAADSSIIRRNVFSDVIMDTIDTGFVKRKVAWYKKIIVAALFLAAVILSAGFAAGSLPAFAAYMSISTIALTGLQIVLANSGQAGLATYVGRFVQFSSVISVIAGISALAQNLASQVARQGIVQTASEAALNLISDVSTTVTQSVTQFGSQALETVTTETVREISTSKILSVALKLTGRLMSLREGNKADRLESQVSELSARNEQLEEELSDYDDKGLHIGIEDIKWYTSPLNVDNSLLEIDYLYEGTKYNIQRPSFYPSTGLNLITTIDET